MGRHVSTEYDMAVKVSSIPAAGDYATTLLDWGSIGLPGSRSVVLTAEYEYVRLDYNEQGSNVLTHVTLTSGGPGGPILWGGVVGVGVTSSLWIPIHNYNLSTNPSIYIFVNRLRSPGTDPNPRSCRLLGIQRAAAFAPSDVCNRADLLFQPMVSLAAAAASTQVAYLYSGTTSGGGDVGYFNPAFAASRATLAHFVSSNDLDTSSLDVIGNWRINGEPASAGTNVVASFTGLTKMGGSQVLGSALAPFSGVKLSWTRTGAGAGPSLISSILTVSRS